MYRGLRNHAFILSIALLFQGCLALGESVRQRSARDEAATLKSPPKTVTKHHYDLLSETGKEAVEIVMSGYFGGYSSTQIALRYDYATSTTPYTTSPALGTANVESANRRRGTTVPIGTPTYVTQWLAIEKSLWHSAYRQGQVHHESVGRRYLESDSEQLAQNAIRQTVRVDLKPGLHCVARRKFYSELFGTAVNGVESYVRGFRIRNGLKPDSPFGVERSKLKDQIYISLRTDTEERQRLELHRVHLVMGMGPGEVVETALICTGKDTSPLTLGRFRYGWLADEGRIYSQFHPNETPHVRSLNLRGSGSLDALTAPESAEESPTRVSQTPPHNFSKNSP